jgi:flagellar biosynthesis protein FliQ
VTWAKSVRKWPRFPVPKRECKRFINHAKAFVTGKAYKALDIHRMSEKLTMTSPEVLDVARDAIWLTIAMSAPVMLVGLVVGLVIGLLQALTQIQEQTLVFVPKILAIFAALLLFLPFMGALLGDFMTQMMERVAAGGSG